jgi:hypothetical protein
MIMEHSSDLSQNLSEGAEQKYQILNPGKFPSHSVFALRGSQYFSCKFPPGVWQYRYAVKYYISLLMTTLLKEFNYHHARMK